MNSGTFGISFRNFLVQCTIRETEIEEVMEDVDAGVEDVQIDCLGAFPRVSLSAALK